MSTASIPGQYPPSSQNFISAAHRLTLVTPNPDSLNLLSAPSTGLIIRRPNHQQGRALEVLSHAIEYLVDSRLFLIDEPSTPTDAQAVQTLMLLSRQVFAECAESVSLARRLQLWIDQRLTTPANC